MEENTKCVDHYFDLYTTLPKTIAKQKPEEMKDTPFEKSWRDLLQQATTYIAKHEPSLREWCKGLLQREVGNLKSNVHQLKQLAGGAPEGAVWDAAFEAGGEQTILDHYRDTLNTVDFEQISTAKTNCKKADIGNGARALVATPLHPSSMDLAPPFDFKHIKGHNGYTKITQERPKIAQENLKMTQDVRRFSSSSSCSPFLAPMIWNRALLSCCFVVVVLFFYRCFVILLSLPSSRCCACEPPSLSRASCVSPRPALPL